MDFTFLLNGKDMTVYECSKRSGIPYSTLSDILHGRTPAEKMNFRTAYYLARTLGISMEDLYKQTHVPERTSMETFKSQIRHDLKRLGDIEFIDLTIKDKVIERYWNFEWFFESFYLLAMIDYLCRINNMAIYPEYERIREYKLPEVCYPADISLAAILENDQEVRRQAIAQSIPEFIRFNIVEKEVRDVF